LFECYVVVTVTEHLSPAADAAETEAESSDVENYADSTPSSYGTCYFYFCLHLVLSK